MSGHPKSDVPYCVKHQDGSLHDIGCSVTTIAIRGDIKNYLAENKLKLSDYATLVRVDKYHLKAFINGMYSLDDFPLHEIYKLMEFHGYEFGTWVRKKETTGE